MLLVLLWMQVPTQLCVVSSRGSELQLIGSLRKICTARHKVYALSSFKIERNAWDIVKCYLKLCTVLQFLLKKDQLFP